MVDQVSNSITSYSSNSDSSMFQRLSNFLRRCVFRVLSTGPIPKHIAFIMDGNRRYAKKQSLEVGSGHKAGFSALMSILNYCYELGVKYVTVYAFSIDNFKRQRDEVQSLMDLMLEKIEELLEKESIVHKYGVKVYFIGNLKLLSEPVRAAAEKVMKATANNNKTILLVCVAYTSSDEIVHAVQEACKDKRREIQTSNRHNYSNGAVKTVKTNDKITGLSERSSYIVQNLSLASEQSKTYDSVNQQSEMIEKGDVGEFRLAKGIKKTQDQNPSVNLVEIEKHMYMAVAPNPDILIRSSGETRLSNFLLWQTSNCPLYSPAALWPEISLRHLAWMVLDFQRNYSYLEKKKKQF